MSDDAKFRVVEMVHEVRVDAPAERLWAALTEETSAWWGKDFYTDPERPRGFHIEPKLDGWMYEDWGDGEGMIWGRVYGVKKARLLQVVGDSDQRYGPCRHFTTWKIEPDGDAACLVRFVESVYGQIPDDTMKGLETGWRFLLDECLKPYVETGAQPERPPSVA